MLLPRIGISTKPPETLRRGRLAVHFGAVVPVQFDLVPLTFGRQRTLRNKAGGLSLKPSARFALHFAQKCTLLRPCLRPMILSTFSAALTPLGLTVFRWMSTVIAFSGKTRPGFL